MSRSSMDYPVIEIFGPTIQGEGVMCGMPTHFLRLGGCGYSCSWCDTMYAVDPIQVKANRTMMDAEAIATALISRGPAPYLTLSGGDPCLHDLSHFIWHFRGAYARAFPDSIPIKIAVETQGQFWKEWLMHCEVITVSPKPPSSGMPFDNDHLLSVISHIWRRVNLKFVIADDTDYEWFLKEFHVGANKLYGHIPITLQPMTPQGAEYSVEKLLEALNWLATKVMSTPRLIDRRAGFRVLPQLHRLMYPNQERGV